MAGGKPEPRGAAPGDWPEVAAYLGQVEERYRKERLRAGHGARYLTPEEEKPVMDAIRRACRLYGRAADGERDAMRRFFADAYSLPWRLWKASAEASKAFAARPSAEALRAALVPLSLEDAVTDSRDTILALRSLLEAARKAGIDPEPVRSEAAAISSARMRTILEAVRPGP